MAKKMTKVERVEKLLRAEIEAGLEEGWHLIVRDIGYSYSGACCAVGMTVRDLDFTLSTPYVEARLRLGIDDDELWSIIAGFDGDGFYEPMPLSMYDLGARLRRDYLEVTE